MALTTGKAMAHKAKGDKKKKEEKGIFHSVICISIIASHFLFILNFLVVFWEKKSYPNEYFCLYTSIWSLYEFLSKFSHEFVSFWWLRKERKNNLFVIPRWFIVGCCWWCHVGVVFVFVLYVCPVLVYVWCLLCLLGKLCPWVVRFFSFVPFSACVWHVLPFE